jgi:hypothetical protein
MMHMPYELACECGQVRAVSGGDAGLKMKCDCGRTIEVPPLHELRQSAGELSLSADVQLQAMLQSGDMLKESFCANCAAATDGLVHVYVICESPQAKSRSNSNAELFGCLLGGIFGWLLMRSATREVTSMGSDVRFHIPVRICDRCRPDIRTAADIKTAMRSIPVCDALFKKYPNANVAIVKE